MMVVIFFTGCLIINNQFFFFFWYIRRYDYVIWCVTAVMFCNVHVITKKTYRAKVVEYVYLQ